MINRQIKTKKKMCVPFDFSYFPEISSRISSRISSSFKFKSLNYSQVKHNVHLYVIKIKNNLFKIQCGKQKQKYPTPSLLITHCEQV